MYCNIGAKSKLIMMCSNLSPLPKALLIYIALLSLSPSNGILATPMDHRVLSLNSRQIKNAADTGTSNSTHTGWKAGPTGRGTTDLLLSCVATIFLAVWSSVILNVQMTADATKKPDTRPPKSPPENMGIIGASCFWLTERLICLWELMKLVVNPKYTVRWKYKFLWALLNTLVPELALAVALGERRNATDLWKQVNELKTDAFELNWDMVMAYYAVMGGYYV